jgi:hypothetical protein
MPVVVESVYNRLEDVKSYQLRTTQRRSKGLLLLSLDRHSHAAFKFEPEGVQVRLRTTASFHSYIHGNSEQRH